MFVLVTILYKEGMVWLVNGAWVIGVCCVRKGLSKEQEQQMCHVYGVYERGSEDREEL